MTPAGTQGFAPHYDDIEAFIMQIEGKKQWRLYKPRSRQEMLPRVSSSTYILILKKDRNISLFIYTENFSQSEIGESILDVVLEPGDLLYFPRGTIHQVHVVSVVKNNQKLNLFRQTHCQTLIHYISRYQPVRKILGLICLRRYSNQTLIFMLCIEITRLDGTSRFTNCYRGG